MAGNEKIGITIDVDSKELGLLLGQLKKLGQGVDAGSEKSERFKRTIIALNQGLELARKAFQFLESTIGKAISKALEFRFSFDPAKQALDDFGDSIEEIHARIGDAFIPGLAALGKALGPVIDKFLKWIETNREFVQAKVAEELTKIGIVAATILATGAKVAFTAWQGLIGVWLVGQFAISKIVQKIQEMRAETQRGFGNFKAAFEFSSAALESAKEAEQAQESLKNAKKDLEEFNSAVDSGKDSVIEALGALKGYALEFSQVEKTGRRATGALEDLKFQINKLLLKSGGKLLEFDPKEIIANFRKAEAALREFQGSLAGTQLNDEDLRRRAGLIVAEFQNALQDVIQLKSKFEQEAQAAFDAHAKAIETDLLQRLSREGEAYRNALEKRNADFKQADDELIEQAKALEDGIVGVVDGFREAFSQIGQVESDTVQRIAITDRQGEVLRYVEAVSSAEIKALEAVGQKASVITETVSIKTKGLLDGLGDFFSNFVDQVIAEFTRMLAADVVKTFFGLKDDKGGGGLIDSVGGWLSSLTESAAGSSDLTDTGFSKAQIASEMGYARGGLVKGYATGGFVGGSGGTDSVLARLTPGELVLPPHMARWFQDLPGLARGGMIDSQGYVRGLEAPATTLGRFGSFSKSVLGTGAGIGGKALGNGLGIGAAGGPIGALAGLAGAGIVSGVAELFRRNAEKKRKRRYSEYKERTRVTQREGANVVMFGRSRADLDRLNRDVLQPSQNRNNRQTAGAHFVR